MDVKTNKTDILGKNLSEIQHITEELGLPKFTAKQIVDWLYVKKIRTFSEMSNLSKKARSLLDEKFMIGRYHPDQVSESSDGTKKYLFHVAGNFFVEAAFIPDKDRATLCVSSQVGCKMGCHFCQTARQGYQRNLSSGEIINQILSIPETGQLTNVVYMGMGEPLNNTENVMKSLEILTAEYGFAWSPKRITVSTIGILPGMKRFLDESKCHLALSLHSPFEEERLKLMPVEKQYKLPQILDLLREYDFSKQRRVSFEYIMFKGLNDSSAHIEELVKILDGIECRINLIRYHTIPDVELETSDDNTIRWFKEELNKRGLLTTIRASRGQDIEAACGLLSTKKYLLK